MKGHTLGFYRCSFRQASRNLPFTLDVDRFMGGEVNDGWRRSQSMKILNNGNGRGQRPGGIRYVAVYSRIHDPPERTPARAARYEHRASCLDCGA